MHESPLHCTSKVTGIQQLVFRICRRQRIFDHVHAWRSNMSHLIRRLPKSSRSGIHPNGQTCTRKVGQARSVFCTQIYHVPHFPMIWNWDDYREHLESHTPCRQLVRQQIHSSSLDAVSSKAHWWRKDVVFQDDWPLAPLMMLWYHIDGRC